MTGQSRDSIIVSIDFGTTYSGSSCTFRGKPEPPDQIPVTRGWPGGSDFDKVPTALKYHKSSSSQPRKRKSAGTSFTISSQHTDLDQVDWGYQINPEDERIRFPKLLLDSHLELPNSVSRDDLQAQLERAGKSAIDVVADYLSKMKGHLFNEMEKRFGQPMMSTTKIELVLTTPAVWSDAAKAATLKAAEKAGLSTNHDLYLVSEPEAAAVYALKQMEGINLAIGDIYIVCDAGGGTVDLISYRVLSISPLRLEECVSGSGDLCGSALLNFRFQEHVKNRMGAELFNEYRKKNARGWSQCLKFFDEHTKREFDPSSARLTVDDKEHWIPLVGARKNSAARVVPNYIILDTSDLTEIFRPVVDSVVGLVNEQYSSVLEKNATPKGVILVGGFGESNHLYNTLKARFAPKNTSGFSVLKPPNAWSAVALGAVIHCLENQDLVVSRMARRHYGVLCAELFNPHRHSLSNKYWDFITKEWKARNQISWHVKKGQKLPTAQATLLNFYDFGLTRSYTSEAGLIVSDEEDAPTEFTRTAKTRVLCNLEAHLHKVPRSRWRFCRSSGDSNCYELDYQIGMKTGPGQLMFDLRVDGVIYGTARADYE